jgi:LuxR family maltose regulon positive regulatory protein
MRHGDTVAVHRALDSLAGEKRAVPAWRGLLADLYLTEGHPEAAVAELAPVLDGSVLLTHEGEEGQALLLDAVARDAMGQHEEAERAVERALGLAERQGWFSMTLSVPMAVPLLRRHPQDRTRYGAFLAEVLERLGEAPEPAADPASPGLSERELQVLRLLPTNLRAGEIASELVLSVHTVKSHMRKIYAKLGAHRRTEAVDRARSVGLLPPTHTKRAIFK